MEPNESRYEQIQQYLNQSLSAEEKTAFEQELQSNEVLAKEVALHREMQAMFANTPENQLLRNLEKLTTEEAFPVKKMTSNWKYWLLLLPIIVIIGGLWYGSNETISEAEQDDSVAPQKEILDTPDPIVPPNDDKAQPNQPAEEIVPPTKTAPPEKRTPPKEPINEPIAAADYSPNPSLDFLIANHVRDASLVLEVAQKQADINVNRSSKTVPFELAASLTTDGNLDDKDFKLHLFSNKKEDFDNFEPLYTFDLQWEATNTNAYTLDFQKNIGVPPGLYYYLIEDFNTEKIYFVEKFEIRLK